MSCDDIYCRREARKRLEEKGYSKEDAARISQEVYEKIKEVYDR